MANWCVARISLSRFYAVFRRTTSHRNQTAHLFPTNPNYNSLFSVKFKHYQQSQYRKEVFLADLFRRYGFTSSQLHNFLSRSRFLLDSSIEELDKSLRVLISFRIPQKSMVYLISNSPGVLEFQFLKKWEIGFSKWETFGASISPLIKCKVLEHCRRFHVDPDEFLKGVEALRVLGFSDTAVTCLLEGYPGVIGMSKAELVSAIEFLKVIEISSNGIERVIRLFPEVLGLGVEDKLKPLLNEFRDLGFSDYEIKETIVIEPRVLGMELGELSRCLQLLNDLKCRISVKEKIFGKGILKAGLEVKQRIDCLCSYGLIRRDAFKILWKEPRVIIYEVEDIKKKLDFLLHNMKHSIDCLTDVPEYLGVNFEKQIVPRHNIMEHLKAKEAIAFEVGLRDLIKPSRLRFYNLYVKPYPECEKMYGRFSRSAQVKRQHPVGLWKLFKPQKEPESREDVANMKSFMEAL